MPKNITTTSIANNESLLEILQKRFEKNINRHPNISWSDVEKKLKSNKKALTTLTKMEESGGEPDVVLFDKKSNSFTFYDCVAESPKERRSLCYDKAAWDSRKEFKPTSSAMEISKEIGCTILNEEQYNFLQTLGQFDTKTSSWLNTPEAVRKLGGAIFGDYRFGRVFVYHNGAESYYGSRGFRGMLVV